MKWKLNNIYIYIYLKKYYYDNIMNSLLYSSNPIVLVSSIIFGASAYYIKDYKYYRVSKWVHYGSMICGVYMYFNNFLPGCFFLGFHIAYHFNF